MEPIPHDRFFKWLDKAGIGFAEGYPQSTSPTLLPLTDCARFWVVPPDPRAWPHFAEAVLDGLDDWEVGYLWRYAEKWPKPSEALSRNEKVRDTILRGAGIPDGWAGAIRCSREEITSVLAVLFSAM